jgi:branched-chain amino acid transport system permease protein
VFGTYDDAVFGIILIVIMLFAPDGLLRINLRHKFSKLSSIFRHAGAEKEGQ